MSKKVKTLKGIKRGYNVTIKNKVFNFGEGRHRYEVYEVAGPKMDKTRYFVDEESVRMFINSVDGFNKLEKAFDTAVKRATTKSERKEMLASKELTELTDVDFAKNIDASIRDTKAKRPSELG